MNMDKKACREEWTSTPAREDLVQLCAPSNFSLEMTITSLLLKQIRTNDISLPGPSKPDSRAALRIFDDAFAWF